MGDLGAASAEPITWVFMLCDVGKSSTPRWASRFSHIVRRKNLRRRFCARGPKIPHSIGFRPSASAITLCVLRFTFYAILHYASRITHPASRTTHHGPRIISSSFDAATPPELSANTYSRIRRAFPSNISSINIELFVIFAT